MSFSFMSAAFVYRDKNNDCRSNYCKNNIECDLAICEQHITEHAPKERNTYSLTICYLSACHRFQLD